MKEICKPYECTGCAACANSCGHHAITISPDSFGYLRPTINSNLCVDCGLCSKVCPNNNPPIFTEPLCAYVGCASDPKEQLTSTSGGIASVITRDVIKRGGVVFGCTSKDIHKIKHIKITTESEINLLKGSKYVQSDILNTYSDAKSELIQGRDVLFIGTPCQIAGLKSYLPNKLQTHLITVDFVCHGVPSQQILNDALNELKVENDVATLQFRIKEYASSKFSCKKTVVIPENVHTCPIGSRYTTQYGIFTTNREQYIYSPFPTNNYIVGFLRGLFYRESCYNCHYAQVKRVSDITLGDFRYSNETKNKLNGTNRQLSKIIINTNNGRNIIKRLSQEINLENIDLEYLVKNGGQLSHPMPIHPKRELFLQEYLKHGFSVASKILEADKKRIRRNITITKIRDVIYTIPMCKKIIKRLRN